MFRVICTEMFPLRQLKNFYNHLNYGAKFLIEAVKIMIKIKEAIITEGKYDKIKLSQIFDTLIICTDGFNIFKNEEKQALIRRTAKKCGIIIFTDSDRAGFLIRRFICGICGNECIKHAYIPQIKGKEKRKREISKDGFLGVEGTDNSLIVKAIQQAASVVTDKTARQITKKDMYMFGLSGGKGSSGKRDFILKKLDLPIGMSCNAMTAVLNALFTYEEFEKFLQNIY